MKEDGQGDLIVAVFTPNATNELVIPYGENFILDILFLNHYILQVILSPNLVGKSPFGYNNWH